MYYSQPGIFNVLDIKNVGLALLQRMGKPSSLLEIHPFGGRAAF